MVTRVILGSVMLLSLIGSREMQVLSRGGSNPSACSECRFLAAACCNQEKPAAGSIDSLRPGLVSAKNLPADCCPAGDCCPTGSCCTTATSKACCPTGACCPDGPCCAK